VALRNPLMVKTGAGVTTLSLEATTGKSLLVKDIYVKSVADKYLTVKIDRLTVGYFRVDSADLGNLLHYPLTDLEKKTILGLLAEKGLFTGYPVAEGQTLELSGLGSSALTATILYEEYDAGDITADKPNGTDSNEFLYIVSGHSGANINTAGEHLLDTVITPAEFPAFPFGAAVPARYEVDLLALLASERGADDGSTAANYIHTTYLKLVRDREVLFDDDRNGLYLQGSTVSSGGAFEPENGQGVVGEYSDTARRLPLFFTPPLTFTAGEELNVYLTTEVASTAGTFTTTEQEVGFVVRARRLT